TFLVMLLVTAFVLLPVAIIVLTAFKPTAEVNAYPPTLVPTQWTVDNLLRIFTELPVARLLLNSVVFAGGGVLCALVCDSLAAYALGRIYFRRRLVLLVTLIASLMLPFRAPLSLVYDLVVEDSAVNTHQVHIAPRTAAAFGFFLLRQFFLVL